MTIQDAKLYTRQGCHLCDDAYEILTQNGILPELIDIDQDADLARRFGECVPVIEIGGKIRFRGVVSQVLLNRILRGLDSQ